MTLERYVTIPRLKELAANLKSEDGENPEYDRALVELVLDAEGLSTDHREAVARELGIVTNAGASA